MSEKIVNLEMTWNEATSLKTLLDQLANWSPEPVEKECIAIRDALRQVGVSRFVDREITVAWQSINPIIRIAHESHCYRDWGRTKLRYTR